MLWWYFLGATLFGAGLAYLYEHPQGRAMMLQEAHGSPKRLAITCAFMCLLWPLALLISLCAFIVTIWRR
jgi:hypothetical protein